MKLRKIENIEVCVGDYSNGQHEFIEDCWGYYGIIAIVTGMSPNGNHEFALHGFQDKQEEWDENCYSGGLKENYGL